VCAAVPGNEHSNVFNQGRDDVGIFWGRYDAAKPEERITGPFSFELT
jgi:hypothetical protein